MFSFDRKPRPSLAPSPAAKPPSPRQVNAPPMNPPWFRLATSSNAGAATSSELTEARRRDFEPRLPALASAPWSRVARAGSETEAEAEASQSVAPGPVAPAPRFDWARFAVRPPPIQRKATISSPGDPYEREADEVADSVMRTAEPGSSDSAPVSIQRKCAACKDEESTTIQTKRAPSAGAGAGLDTGAAVRAAERGGQPLPASLRAWFEPRFGRDLGGVRVHTDSEAADGARAVRARAYTIGSDIVFGSGEYAPSTVEGRRLLAHELTHTIQQRALPSGGGPGSIHRLIQRSCHTVAAKETIYGIASKYGVTEEALLDANGLKATDTLPVGKTLVVPDGKPCSHTVASDETLYSIGRIYGATVDDIKAANKLTSNTIAPGQVLTIPVAGGPSSVSYTVKAKDTLYSIAKAHGVSVADIQKANGMTGTDIAMGQTLTIPMAGGTPAPAKPPATPAATPAKPPATPAVTPASPPATPAPTKPAATPAPASTSTDSGHDPGKDYASGVMREDSFLRKSDKATYQVSGGVRLFFQTGDTVTLKASSADWIEVEGPVFKAGKPAVAAGTGKGWIMRAWTSMTMGDYKDVPVDDRTEDYGKLASGSLPKKDVNSVILHQTGSSSGSSTLAGYSSRIAANQTIGAHYLIDENGKITLTVPVDKKVSHVGKTKPGYDTSSNSHAIGIEHSGAEEALDLPSSSKDTATIAANRAAIKAMELSPNLKARLIAMKDAELYQVARDNRDPDTKVKKWYLYGDINAAQKRSSFVLASKLMADFGLAEKDLLPHETVSWKTIGEGENIKEYLAARSAYPGLVISLRKLVSGDAKLAADATLSKIVADEETTVVALAVDATAAETTALATEKSGGKGGVATAREALRTAFYKKFWARHTQLVDLVKFLGASGSSKPAELAKKLSAWVT